MYDIQIVEMIFKNMQFMLVIFNPY
ncbi:hypothetical protein Syncc8109_0454 [Synechococcus sp. WH 8109]|nr:hypothetical protein Syncc8109_0454 [Synechococcus sp. WH 8109]